MHGTDADGLGLLEDNCMQLGHCMSYREESGRLYMVGSCPYANQRDGVADDDGYVALPDNVSELSFY